MDERVLEVQSWLNITYYNNQHYSVIEENGKTGWITIRALTTALQIELGIAQPTGSFGPTTTSLCPTLSTSSPASNIVKILQGALFCKGYNPTGFTGTYGNGTATAIRTFQADAGFTNPTGVTTPMFFKALLNMDAFVLLGDPKVRTIQQNLNRDYHTIIGLIPTDGRYERNTNKALIYALQVEEGIATPTGSFGPQTLSLVPTLQLGSTATKFIYILQYALYVNGFDPNGFDGSFGYGCRNAVIQFQQFAALTANGIVGRQTWASLMVSYGDKERPATASDCVTTITPERALTLKNNGYNTVGRYIVGDWKKIKDGELDTIFSNGHKVFPIYQTSGNNLKYFNAPQGSKDALAAIKAAKSYGFKSNTIIYFAVDFDALDGDVTTNILPYFKALHHNMSASTSGYRVGVYGPRNVCSRVSNAGYAVTSFVCDMSSGFSGNLGYPLPSNWAFDQIATITIGTGAGQIEIDKNVASGRDPASSSVDPVGNYPIEPNLQNNIFFQQLDTVYSLALDYANNDIYMANQYTMQYFRHHKYNGLNWTVSAGPINQGFIDLVNTSLNNPPVEEVFYDRKTGIAMDAPHFFATMNSYTFLTDNSVIPEFAGWAGDLMTLIGDAMEAWNTNPGSSFYQVCVDKLGSSDTTFNFRDVLADVDAANVAKMLNNSSTLQLPTAMRDYYLNMQTTNERFSEFAQNEFGGIDNVYQTTVGLLLDNYPDLVAIRLKFKDAFGVPDYTEQQGKDAALAWWSYINNHITAEHYPNS